MYPADIWSPTTKTNKVDLVDAAHINDLQNHVVAIETELGTDPAGSEVDLKTRLAISIADDGAMQKGTSYPSSPVACQLFYRTDLDAPYYRNAANDAWESFRAGPVLYYEPDSTCIIAFDNGSLAVDLSSLHNAITLTSLAETDLVDGKISGKCYDYDGLNDYATIAHNALQAGMSDITLEAWVYRDTAGNIDHILKTDVDGYLALRMTDTQIAGNITGSTGTETWAVNHNLSNNGINQWVYIVVTCTLGTVADIYVNGSNIGNGNGSGSGTVSDSANGINIGADEADINKFHGKIDGLRILRRKMAAAEVTDRYNAFK